MAAATDKWSHCCQEFFSILEEKIAFQLGDVIFTPQIVTFSKDSSFLDIQERLYTNVWKIINWFDLFIWFSMNPLDETLSINGCYIHWFVLVVVVVVALIYTIDTCTPFSVITAIFLQLGSRFISSLNTKNIVIVKCYQRNMIELIRS